jgi:thiol-disulfide isomerase/thioredoxin
MRSPARWPEPDPGIPRDAGRVCGRRSGEVSRRTDRLGRFRIVLFVLLFSALLSLPSSAQELPPGRGQGVVLSFFSGAGCPHCEKEKQFLVGLHERYPDLVIREYEVWGNRENAALFKRVLQTAKVSGVGVPATVVGTSLFLGFTEQTRQAIEEAVARCVRDGCPDGVGMIGSQSLSSAGPDQGGLAIPLLGTVDPVKVSLPLFTFVIAGLDSFNPCAFFVLLFLLSLLIHARSRGRMLLIGGVFVLFSGAVYFLFMAAWLSVFMVIGQLTAITVIGGVIALLVGLINVKDFFFYRKGVSLVIPEEAKPGLFARMRGLLRAQTVPAMIGGAVVLALTANAYELLCTAGFPMVYTRVLTLHNLTTLEYYEYLLLYNVVYVIPLAVIVGIITVTLGARKLTEWQGRQLKLVSGLMMLSLGLILAVNPALLNSVVTSALLLAGVVIVAGLMIFVMRKVKPEVAYQ